MASGDSLFEFLPGGQEPISTGFAVPVVDGTAGEELMFLAYDDTTTESAIWVGMMPSHYDGSSSIDVTLLWYFTTFVGSQTCDWEVSFYRIADDADSVANLVFATAQTTLATEASAAGELDYATITFTNAQADGIQPDELFAIKVTRDATGGTASPGDAYLKAVYGTVS